MMTITVYGGAGQIGGNIIHLVDQTSKASVLFDFGRSFAAHSKFFSFPERPRISVKLEILKTGLAPLIPGEDIYADLAMQESLAAPKDRRPSSQKPRTEISYKILEPEKACSITDLFISHSHSDHCGLSPLLRRDIRVNIGETTHVLFKSYYEAATRDSIEAKLYLTEEDLNADRKKNLARSSYRTFHGGEVIRPTDSALSVEPCPVDHSVAGAYGFIIHSSSGPVVYTGDFRTHGVAKVLTERFLDRIKSAGKIKALICEGTNLGESKVFSEKDVERSARSLIDQSLSQGNRFVLVEVPQADLDRIRTFTEVARDLDLEALVSKRIANYLYELRAVRSRLIRPLPTLGKGVKIFVERRHPARRDRVFTKLEDSYSDSFVELKNLQDKGYRGFMIIDANEVDLFTLHPPPRSLCILSTCEPFTEEADFDFDRWKNQLALFGAILYHIHSSGHIHPLELQRFIDAVSPEILIPVHTEHPEVFRELFESRTLKVDVPTKGVPIKIE
jgi:ribonuclease J